MPGMEESFNNSVETPTQEVKNFKPKGLRLDDMCMGKLSLGILGDFEEITAEVPEEFAGGEIMSRNKRVFVTKYCRIFLTLDYQKAESIISETNKRQYVVRNMEEEILVEGWERLTSSIIHKDIKKKNGAYRACILYLYKSRCKEYIEFVNHETGVVHGTVLFLKETKAMDPKGITRIYPKGTVLDIEVVDKEALYTDIVDKEAFYAEVRDMLLDLEVLDKEAFYTQGKDMPKEYYELKEIYSLIGGRLEEVLEEENNITYITNINDCMNEGFYI